MIVTLAGLAWLGLYFLSLSMDMPGMDEADMAIPGWSMDLFALDAAMWITMMVGMMLPSALPVILLYRRVVQAQPRPVTRLALFVSAYLAVWVAFSVAATVLQELLQHGAWVSLMSVRAVPALAAAVLIVAGVYQFLPLKDACLDHCRSPLTFLMHHSLRTIPDAWRTGLHHGLYCLGCCWALMLVLFAVGAMNMLWAAALGAFVLLEKVTPGPWISRISGIALLSFGIFVLTAALP